MVPLFDPHPQHVRLRAQILPAVNAVLDSGQFIMGPNVQSFEEEAAAYHGVKHAIGVASGTDALLLALLAAGVGAGDEVITSPFTFIATLEAIYQCGAEPVFADIDPATMNLDPEATAAVITERSRAILPVHLFGQSAQLAPLLNLAQKHQLRLIGDCAQAFGARYQGISVGALGDAGCFSFFPTKNLGGYGDGGLITTDSDELAYAVRVLRNHGSREQYYHDKVGYNSRLDEVQAAALRVKLRHLEEFNESRRAIAAIYDQELPQLGVQTPKVLADCHHVYGQYTILVNERDHLRAALQQRGIGCAIYYPVPLHRQSVCADVFRDQCFPVCEQITEQCLSLPMFPGMTEAQAREVIAAVADALSARQHRSA